jgi:NAD(P)-dependent dehydrogenase (short-subunit alcohol dehydrogenase family)
VNNAGILRDKSFHNMTVDQIDAVIDVHLRGSFYVTHAAWGHMRDQAYGRIINTSSNSGILGNFGQANYGAAKMGLVGMMNVLALEGAKHNIKVNSIAPLAFTRMTADLMPGFEEKVRPEMVTPVVIYLAHETCEVTGEIYSVGGGTVSRFFVGLTPGYANPALTAEDVRDNLGAIRDETGYVVLRNNGQELKKIFTMLS